MAWVIGFFVVFALMVLTLVVRTKKAGSRELSDAELSRARPIVRATADDPDPGWSELGSKTTAEGLRLRFDADDDPRAEAVLLARRDRAGSTRFGHKRTIRLSETFETHHVHTSGDVFRVRLRGNGRTHEPAMRPRLLRLGDLVPKVRGLYISQP